MKIASVKVEADDLPVVEGPGGRIISLTAQLQAVGAPSSWATAMVALIAVGSMRWTS